MRAILLLPLVALVVVMPATPAAQAPTTAAATELVELAGRYADAYFEAFSAVVSEEHQVQTLIRADGRVKKTREIVADFLLVKAGATWPQAFRDVIAVDGKPVRNREDRLRKLFLEHPKEAPALVRAIADESGRYNLGVTRRGNSPMLPIMYLTPRVAPRVRFSGTAAALLFREVQRPTLLTHRYGSSSYDMPAHGSFEIDPATGRVLVAEVTADEEIKTVLTTFKVRYAIDPKLEINVPVEMTERYTFPSQPKDDVLEVTATYSSFRRFEVTTGEQIKK